MSNEKNDGGPAYPCAANESLGGYPANGMTLRDWFAGQALVGFTERYSEPELWWLEQVAKDCYAMADAMLKAREQ